MKFEKYVYFQVLISHKKKAQLPVTVIGNEKPPADSVEHDSQEPEPQDTQQAEAPDNVAVDSSSTDSEYSSDEAYQSFDEDDDEDKIHSILNETDSF